MRALFVLGILLVCHAAGHAAEALLKHGVVLLQPSAVTQERVPSVDAMADYIKAIEAAAQEAVAGHAARQSVSGFIVVAVRPGLKAKAWLDFDTLVDLDLQRQIAVRVQAVQPFAAKGGLVVFAVKVGTWGAKPSKRQVPLPAEWRHASRDGAPQAVEALVQHLWPEQPE
jgi:hypothetical protein